MLGLGDVGHQVAVRQHDALGHAGRAAGIGKRHQVFGRVDVDREIIDRLRQQFAEWGRAVGGAEDKDFLDGRVLDRFTGPIHERRNGQQESGAGIPELIAQLASGVQGVDGGDGPAQRRDGEERDRVLDEVRAEDREHVAFLEAAPSQSRCNPFRAVSQRAVGQFASGEAVDQRRFGAQVAGPVQDERNEGALRDIDSGTAVDHSAIPSARATIISQLGGRHRVSRHAGGASR